MEAGQGQPGLRGEAPGGKRRRTDRRASVWVGEEAQGEVDG